MEWFCTLLLFLREILLYLHLTHIQLVSDYTEIKVIIHELPYKLLFPSNLKMFLPLFISSFKSQMNNLFSLKILL